MLDCRHVVEQLGDYLDDDVAASLRRDIETHLAECRTCTALYDSTRRVLRIVTDSRSFEIPEAVSDRIMKRLMSRIRPA